MNIVEPILYQCKLNPFATAIATPGSGLNSIKYGQLERLIHNVARAALRTGLAPGQTVALLIEDAILQAALILGLMRIGIVTMSLAEGRVPEHLKADVVMTDSPQLFAGQTQSVIAANNSWLQGEGTALDYTRVYRGNQNDICRIALTSGSTGKPKGIAFSHKVLAERLANYSHAKGALFARASRLFCDLGIASSPGFRYLTYMLSRGGTIYFSGRDPTAILHYLHPFKVQGMAVSPHNLETIVHAFEEDPDLDSAVEFIICQGARLSRELMERARSSICQNLFITYGSTETTTVACGPAHAIGHIPGAVGFVVPSGLAAGSITTKSTSGCCDGEQTDTFHYSQSKTRWGWVAGGGVEHMWTRNWTIGTEVLFVDFGAKTYCTKDCSNRRVTGQVITARTKLNYKF